MTNARFIKIGADGARLPSDAPEWEAVLDTTTDLMWSAQETKEMPWAECVEAAPALRDAGFSDWRLPTRKELLTLVDDTRAGPAIDTAFFPDCKSDWYWTSTPYASSPSGCAWVVNFNNGYSSWYGQGGEGFVRAVRSSQSLGAGGDAS